MLLLSSSPSLAFVMLLNKTRQALRFDKICLQAHSENLIRHVSHRSSLGVYLSPSEIFTR